MSARIEMIWSDVMGFNGWRNFCESTTEFNNIGYAYTRDCPDNVKDYGERLWKVLMVPLQVEGDEVRLSQWPMNTVTRRRELWDK